MTVFLLLGVILVLAGASFILARQRAMASAQGDLRKLHSLPGYYGWHGAIMVLVPALVVLIVWLVTQPIIVERSILSGLPVEMVPDETAADLVMGDVRRVAAGLNAVLASGALSADEIAKLNANSTNIRETLAGVGVALGGDVSPEVLSAAQKYDAMTATAALWRMALIIALCLAGMAYAIRVTNADFRARNRVEQVSTALLILASSIAILTTVGIVYSMFSETVNFFRQYPIADFFFGLTWSPNFRGNSEFGILPLVWGTMYISLISMLVSVPVGLFAAIYLSEYATPKVRFWVKPLIEIIAGIPTVVFGLFALVTVGPLLRDYFAEPLGLGNSGSSVMTAGLVIGIMNIPFISSLSDDIINAVPQSMRDGSYGLGATKSETIRQVVLPAALPGVVGAILMAASRAIGETMIVVMGAGAAAKLDLNPFEAMTTMTVKIVGQLTGDTDFASPETLVAFALGMTLFVITLCLNVFALYIVRKYREQYE